MEFMYRLWWKILGPKSTKKSLLGSSCSSEFDIWQNRINNSHIDTQRSENFSILKDTMYAHSNFQLSNAVTWMCQVT